MHAPAALHRGQFRFRLDRVAVAANPRGGGGRGRGPVEAPPATPEASLAAALEPMPTVGFLWSSEVAGYAIRYAAKFATPDGGQRIVLITDHRLGQTNEMWTPTSGTASNLGFSVIELHLNAKGEEIGRAHV